MSKTLQESPLTTPNARKGLPVGKHWRSVSADVHLGYRKGKRAGRWFVRWRLPDGRYKQEGIGAADDGIAADGLETLNFEQAKSKASHHVEQVRQRERDAGKEPIPTIREVVEVYIAKRKARAEKQEGARPRDAEGRLTLHALSHSIAEMRLDKLSDEDLADWRAGLPESLASSSVRRIVNDFKASLNGVPPKILKRLLEMQKLGYETEKARRDATAPVKPNIINAGDGQLYNADNGAFISAPNAGRTKVGEDITSRQAAATDLGLKPGDPAYQSYVLTGKMPREDQSPLTATDKKAILEADEAVAAAENSISALRGILTPGTDGRSLNDKASYGWGAGAQSFLARNDPTGFFDDDKGQATTELDNIVQTNALQSLKSIFGGNPTEGERAILLDIQGSSSKSPAERKAIFERAITMAERRLAFNQQRAEELRGGTFYKQGGSNASGGSGVNING